MSKWAKIVNGKITQIVDKEPQLSDAEKHAGTTTEQVPDTAQVGQDAPEE